MQAIQNYSEAMETDIEKAARLIKAGKVVAFPTETVYGLGANALDAAAVVRIFEIKERPAFDPLIVHIAHLKDLPLISTSTDERVMLLAEKFWPGPLTIVLPKTKLIPDIVTSGLPTVGVRMPNHSMALEMINTAGCPVAAPSANKFGRVSPTNAAHVRKQLPCVDFVLDGGPTKVGIESTIVTLHESGFEILRHGFITREQLEEVLPYFQGESKAKTAAAPGMLKSHYSPIKPLYLLSDKILGRADLNNAGFISFSGIYNNRFENIVMVSKNTLLSEYAVNLFSAIHSLEESNNIEYIVAEPVNDEGIGMAIMDRLRKAAYQYL